MDPENPKQNKYLDNNESSQNEIGEGTQDMDESNQNTLPQNQQEEIKDDQLKYDDEILDLPYKENSPNYQGEQIDRNLINGPIQNRFCTNFICFVLFCAYFTGIGFLSIYSFTKGDIYRLGVPQDTYGNKCGYTEGFEEFEKIYYPFIDTDLTKFACVIVCPDHEDDKIEEQLGNIHQIYNDQNWYVETKMPVYGTFQEGRTCVPKDYKQAKRIQEFKQAKNNIDNHFSDLRNSWPVLVGGVFLVICIGYIYLILMKYCAIVMTWSSIFLYLLLLFTGGGLFYSQANQMGPYEGENITSDQKSEYTLFAAIFWVLGGLSLIYLCLNWKKIRTGIAFLRCSIEFTRDQVSLFVYPLFITIVYVIFVIFWIYSALCIWSSGDSIIDNSDKNENDKLDTIDAPYEHTEYDKGMQFMMIFHIIGYFWVSQLFVSFSEYIVANSTVMWYFYKNEQGFKTGVPGYTKISILRGFQHLGSLMFGSICTGIFTIINILLFLFHKCSEKEREQRFQQLEQQGRITKKGCSCCVALAYFYEGHTRFISKNSYIQTAITGKNFMPASHDSYYLQKRNQFYFDAMSGIGVMMIFIGKLFIVGVVTFVSYLILRNTPQISDYSISTSFPTVFIGFTTYFIGAMYVCIYGTSSDSILQCFCLEDELFSELREEDQLRYQRYIPPTLQEFLEKSNLIKKMKKPKGKKRNSKKK